MRLLSCIGPYLHIRNRSQSVPMTEKGDYVRIECDHIRTLDCPDCGSIVIPCRECDVGYCSCCDRHVIYTDRPTFAENHSASDVARALGTLANSANEVGLRFGKIFEEEYQQYWYRRQHGGFDGYGSLKHAYFPKREDSLRIAYRLREDDIYSSERWHTP